MTHMLAEMQEAAAQALAGMQRAARHARTLHARAELMRHMLGTADALRGRPDAVPGVVREWMAAWAMDAADWPSLATAMQRFTQATCEYDATRTDAADASWRASLHALDEAMAAEGLSLADQMAWRSECAHGWWGSVEPRPAGLPPRPGVPVPEPGKPFWDAACAPRCLPPAGPIVPENLV